MCIVTLECESHKLKAKTRVYFSVEVVAWLHSTEGSVNVTQASQSVFWWGKDHNYDIMVFFFSLVESYNSFIWSFQH